MQNEDAKQIPIDFLKNTPVMAEIQKLMQVYEQAQITAYNLVTNDNKGLLKLRAGTVLTLAVVNKIANGKNPKDFSKEDWGEIAKQVIDIGINVDDSYYSTFVFMTYADYIEVSVLKFESKFTKDECKKIRSIATDIQDKTSQFSSGEISEVKYTEECLWLSLEAMIKLLAAYAGSFVGEDFSKLISGASSFAFEYARLMLYKREQALLEEYLRHQYELDEELRQKYDEYLMDIEKQAAAFTALVQGAFAADFRNSLRGSVELARAVGVKQDEILDSLGKIDDFFM